MSDDSNINMSREEFCRRFVEHMISRAGETLADGATSIREYAEDTAPTYWENEDQRREGPEECADSDISYWGE